MFDIHPIIVHFPIALLTIYSIMELIRFKKVLEKPYWFYIKATLVIIGATFALITFLTAPDEGGVRLVDMHKRFAFTTMVVYLIVALGYVSAWFKPSQYSNFVLRPLVIMPLALIGLAAITITGGLGGAIVYGTEFDPFMAPIFKLLNVY